MQNAQSMSTSNIARKSTTVQEIEKLERNREERRAQQELQRARKEELKNMDPGNKNWEFAAMIRDYRSGIEIKPLRANDRVEDRRITVAVRKRPLNKKELNKKVNVWSFVRLSK